MPTLVATAYTVLLLGGGETNKQQKEHEDEVTYEQVVKADLRITKTGLGILTTVKDKSTADAATVKLRVLGREARAWAAKLAKLGAISAEDKAGMEKKYKQEIEEIDRRWKAEEKRLRMVDGGPEVFQEFNAAVTPPRPK